mmetsp:Transcript_17137/g.25167  ORF Transcript_17137/g.25167 Transcript_17137/m.25167 type:complete len:116 (-) Transcript_17137:81-428(-)
MKNGRINKKDNWLAKKNVGEIESICAMTEADKVSCERCASRLVIHVQVIVFRLQTKTFSMMKKGKPLRKNCQWLSNRKDDQIAKICSEDLDPSDEYPPAMIGCPVICESCKGAEQ